MIRINLEATEQEKKEAATEIIHSIYENWPDLCEIMDGNENWIKYILYIPDYDICYMITETDGRITEVIKNYGSRPNKPHYEIACDFENMNQQFYEFKDYIEEICYE